MNQTFLSISSKFINKDNVFGITNEFNQASLHIGANANGKIVFWIW